MVEGGEAQQRRRKAAGVNGDCVVTAGNSHGNRHHQGHRRDAYQEHKTSRPSSEDRVPEDHGDARPGEVERRPPELPALPEQHAAKIVAAKMTPSQAKSGACKPDTRPARQ